MPKAKWKAPCNLCKGLFKQRCMFCGWQIAPKKKVSEMKNGELAELNGKRNRREFMMALDSSSTRAGNCSTHHDETDKFLMEHRAWALEMLHRHEAGESIKNIADDQEMTTAFMKKVIRMTGDKLIRGQFSIGFNPSMTPNIIPDQPMPTNRKPVTWSEEPEDD